MMGAPQPKITIFFFFFLFCFFATLFVGYLGQGIAFRVALTVGFINIQVLGDEYRALFK